MYNILRTDCSNPGFKKLIIQLDKELKDNYNTAQNEYDHYNKLNLSDSVIVIYNFEKFVGCGCFKDFDNNTVEIKRMYVAPEFRGKGLSKTILSELERWAIERKYKFAVLETGVKQHTAIELYKSSGYLQTNNYGQYVNMPYSICFRKQLNPL